MYLNNLSWRFPETNFVIAHLAFNLFWDAVTLHQTVQNVYIETSMQTERSLAYRTLLTLEKCAWGEGLLTLRLDKRVMFGLDLSPEAYPGYIEAWHRFLDASGHAQHRNDYFYHTAARVLGLESS